MLHSDLCKSLILSFKSYSKTLAGGGWQSPPRSCCIWSASLRPFSSHRNGDSKIPKTGRKRSGCARGFGATNRSLNQKKMTEARITEMELICAAHPGHKSSALILECLAEIVRLQKRSTRRLGFLAPKAAEVEALFVAGAVFRNGSAAQQASAFIDHYESNGWRVGRVPMTNWQAAARGWQRRAAEKIAPVLPRSSEPRMI